MAVLLPSLSFKPTAPRLETLFSKGEEESAIINRFSPPPPTSLFYSPFSFTFFANSPARSPECEIEKEFCRHVLKCKSLEKKDTRGNAPSPWLFLGECGKYSNSISGYEDKKSRGGNNNRERKSRKKCSPVAINISILLRGNYRKPGAHISSFSCTFSYSRFKSSPRTRVWLKVRATAERSGFTTATAI